MLTANDFSPGDIWIDKNNILNEIHAVEDNDIYYTSSIEPDHRSLLPIKTSYVQSWKKYIEGSMIQKTRLQLIMESNG